MISTNCESNKPNCMGELGSTSPVSLSLARSCSRSLFLSLVLSRSLSHTHTPPPPFPSLWDQPFLFKGQPHTRVTQQILPAFIAISFPDNAQRIRATLLRFQKDHIIVNASPLPPISIPDKAELNASPPSPSHVLSSL